MNGGSHLLNSGASSHLAMLSSSRQDDDGLLASGEHGHSPDLPHSLSNGDAAAAPRLDSEPSGAPIEDHVADGLAKGGELFMSIASSTFHVLLARYHPEMALSFHFLTCSAC